MALQEDRARTIRGLERTQRELIETISTSHQSAETTTTNSNIKDAETVDDHGHEGTEHSKAASIGSPDANPSCGVTVSAVEAIVAAPVGRSAVRGTAWHHGDSQRASAGQKLASRSKFQKMLVTHLKRASDALKTDQGRIMAQNASNERCARRKRIESLHSTREADERRLSEILKEVAEKERALTSVCTRETAAFLQRHYAGMKGYIKTSAEPTVFWKPVKHNDMTRSLADLTALHIEMKVSKLAERQDAESLASTIERGSAS